jgi:hypothetical protein
VTLKILAIDLEVQCANGTTHAGVKLAIDGKRRIYLTEDGTELNDVETISKCTAVVHPLMLAAMLHQCEAGK